MNFSNIFFRWCANIVFLLGTITSVGVSHALLSTDIAPKKIVWVTDMHLNDGNLDAFTLAMQGDNIEAIFMTGDIANADLIQTLRIIANKVTVPIYVILGNSDHAYGDKTDQVRRDLKVLMQEKPNLHYLYNEIKLFDATPKSIKTAIVGLDGYADSWGINPEQIKSDIAVFERNVEDAITQGAQRIVMLTHVPPFSSDCWYNGEPTSADRVMDYSSTSSGDSLSKLANKHPNVTFVVYAGHTHNSSYQVYPKGKTLSNPNISVYVGNKFTASAANRSLSMYTLPQVSYAQSFYALKLDDFLPESFSYKRGKEVIDWHR